MKELSIDVAPVLKVLDRGLLFENSDPPLIANFGFTDPKTIRKLAALLIEKAEKWEAEENDL